MNADAGVRKTLSGGACDLSACAAHSRSLWMSKRGWILFLSLGLLWGMPYLLIRVAVADIDPLVVAGSRTLLGSMLLLPFALRQTSLGSAFRKWKPLLAFTVIEITIPWVLLGHAETRLNSSTAGLL